MEIFKKELNRLKLSSTKLNKPNKKLKIAIHRNHSFEMVGSILNVFLNFSGLEGEFLYSDYDDSLNFTDISKIADLHIIWLDLSRYNNIDIKNWIKERVFALKSISNSGIILYTTGEIDLSDINISDVLVANSNNIKNTLQEKFFDLKKQDYSGTRYSNKACLYIARELGLIYIPALVLPKLKAIILDLDNTLYQGVLGEDGINGIKTFYELQTYLKYLKERGLFLAILSKNEFDDVKELFNKREDFPLKFDDFSDLQVNWNSKAENILKISKNLNIGIDAMLYIDDNIGELENVKLKQPDIKTIEATSEEDTLLTLKFYPGLFKSETTIEDKIRTKDIQANRERETLIKSLDENEYFKKLAISLSYNLSPKNDLKRVTELLNKTNQFIFNYARYNETEVNKVYNNKNACIITVSLSDKLSDSGIIGILVAHKENETSVIDELTVSCRALGRNIENLLITKLFEYSNEKLLTTKICLKYKKGERNKPALTWLSKYCNKAIEESEGNILIDKLSCFENKYINIKKIN